jgi:hypothetical protein
MSVKPERIGLGRFTRRITLTAIRLAIQMVDTGVIPSVTLHVSDSGA